MANAFAEPDKILLAYDSGLVTMGDQAHPLELRNERVGGAYSELSGDADTYYEDFTSGLREYVATRGAADGGGFFGGRGADPSALVLGVDFIEDDGEGFPEGALGERRPDGREGGGGPHARSVSDTGADGHGVVSAEGIGAFIVEAPSGRAGGSDEEEERATFEVRDAASGEPLGGRGATGGFAYRPWGAPVRSLGDSLALGP